MADRKHLLHVKSNVAETTDQYGIKDFSVTPKKPNTDDMLFGEIAVNYGKGVEALTIKNSENEIISFVNENDFNEANEIIANGIAKEKSERVEAFNSFKESSVAKMVSITYSELKSLKVSSRLKAGQFYRITDYVTTTTQEDTQSAGHAFDVIVIATDVDTLNENAKTIKHEGDTYFADSNLDAWEIKYDLDNDTTKYTWADETNGKGVIYYMKDEWNNECSYDFKNIQFNVGAKQQSGTKADVFYFTFSVATGENDATVTDYSLNGAYCYGNKMGLYISSNKKYSLNINVFRNTSATSICQNNTFGNICTHNTFGNGCNSNTFGNNCQSNTFGDSCNGNTFGNNCQSNTFGDSCYGNTFGDTSMSNTFGNGCDSNTFIVGCGSNTFGSGCNNNLFGNNCTNNTFRGGCNSNMLGGKCNSNAFGDACYGNLFGNRCQSNTFGDGCENNSFGNSCADNIFGNNCDSNLFGNSCDGNTFAAGCDSNTFGDNTHNNSLGHHSSNNTFGNNCDNNTFENNCKDNTFGNSVRYIKFKKDYMYNNIIENGNTFITVTSSQTTSESVVLQNFTIAQGVNNGSSEAGRLTISNDRINNDFRVTYQDSNSTTVNV